MWLASAPSSEASDIVNTASISYTVGVWGSHKVYMEPDGDTAASGSGDNTTYTSTSLPSNKDFLVGTATAIEPYNLIDLSSSGGRCNECHNEILFHGGGRRNVETCLLCHATAGSEDWPNYRANSSGSFPTNATTGVTINFRTMLHKIHMGEELANASTYKVNGYNASETDFEHIGFPAMPGGVGKNCDKCHGATSTAWYEPSDRTHPTIQTLPMRKWRPVCLSCHDTNDAQGHYNLMVSSDGYESCGACHDPNSVYAVKVVHKRR
jgi:OmcA/MtrC family decaheme c-type cytochrome